MDQRSKTDNIKFTFFLSEEKLSNEWVSLLGYKSCESATDALL